MKKSTLKEVIKSEIKSLLLENQMDTDAAFKTLRTVLAFLKKHNSYPNPELMEKALDILQRDEVSRMMDREPSFKGTGERAGFDMRGINEIKSKLSEEIQIGDKVTLGGDGDELEVINMRQMFDSDMTAYVVRFPNGKTEEYSGDQLRPTTEFKEFDPNDLDGDDIDDDRLRQRVQRLRHTGSNFDDLNESLNPEVTKALDRFITSMARKYGYEEQDAVYAIMAALEQRKSDTKYDMPGFRDTMDALDDISIREEDEKLKYPEEGEVVFYEGEPHEVMRIVRHNDGQGPRIYIRPKEESAILGKKDTFWVRPGDIEGTDLREEEEPTSAELKKKDSIAATSNKLQKLTKKMKDIAGSYKRAKKANATNDMEKYVEQLKKMTKEKKQLEKAL